MNIFKNIIILIKSLTLVDVIFFFSVIMLFILILSLIYFIKMNKDNEEIPEIKIEKQKTEDEISKEEFFRNNYEKEQEEKAIISYEELVNNNHKNQINYVEEKKIDDLSVRKINLGAITEETDVPKLNVRVISYQREEEFLKALKILQSSL